MVAKRRPPVLTRPDHEKLLLRIAKRYQQLDEKLQQLEMRLPRDHVDSPLPAAPNKPR